MGLVGAVCAEFPAANQSHIWNAIRDNGMKNNRDYAAYNFRNKNQEDEYKASGKLPKAIPSIYNQKALKFLVNVLKSAGEDA